MFKFSNKLQSSKALRILNCHAFGKNQSPNNPPTEKFVCKNINQKGDSSSLFSEFPPPFYTFWKKHLRKQKGERTISSIMVFESLVSELVECFQSSQLAICT